MIIFHSDTLSGLRTVHERIELEMEQEWSNDTSFYDSRPVSSWCIDVLFPGSRCQSVMTGVVNTLQAMAWAWTWSLLPKSGPSVLHRISYALDVVQWDPWQETKKEGNVVLISECTGSAENLLDLRWRCLRALQRMKWSHALRTDYQLRRYRMNC